MLRCLLFFNEEPNGSPSHTCSSAKGWEADTSNLDCGLSYMKRKIKNRMSNYECFLIPAKHNTTLKVGKRQKKSKSKTNG